MSSISLLPVSFSFNLFHEHLEMMLKPIDNQKNNHEKCKNSHSNEANKHTSVRTGRMTRGGQSDREDGPTGAALLCGCGWQLQSGEDCTSADVSEESVPQALHHGKCFFFLFFCFVFGVKWECLKSTRSF